jgi:hypothetical protein
MGSAVAWSQDVGEMHVRWFSAVKEKEGGRGGSEERQWEEERP